MRGEVNLDLADVVLDRDFGVGGMASDDSDAKLSRSDESIKYWLPEATCGLCVKESEVAIQHKDIRRTPTCTMFLYAIAKFGVVG